MSMMVRRSMMQKSDNVNLLNGIESGAYNGTGTDSSATNRLRSVGYVSVESGTKYKFSGETALLSKTVQIFVTCFNQINTSYVSQQGWTQVPFEFTTTNNTNFIRIMIRYSDNSTILASDVTAKIIKA